MGWTRRVNKVGNDKEWGGQVGWTRRVMTRSGVDKEGGQGG